MKQSRPISFFISPLCFCLSALSCASESSDSPASGGGIAAAPTLPTVAPGGAAGNNSGGMNGAGGDRGVAGSSAGGQLATGGADPVGQSGGGAGAPTADGGNGGAPEGGSGGVSLGMNGAADPLLGGFTAAELLERHYFQQTGNQVVMEAEHFAAQGYCASDKYRGKRWWMVHSAGFTPKGTTEFTARCEEAKQELKDVGMVVDGAKTVADLCSPGHGVEMAYFDIVMSTNGESANGLTGNQVFEMFGCDPDENHSADTSNGYIELLPDVLYSNHNAVPHTLSNWSGVPFFAPKAYYRVKFSQAGTWTATARVYRGDSDSGDMFVSAAKTVGAEPNAGETGWTRVTGTTAQWTWQNAGTFQVEAGDHYVVIAGREDGFEADKIVLSQGACQGCDGLGPAETAMGGAL